MSCEVPYMSYMALYILSVHLINCNSRSSVHWKLSLQDGMIVEVSADDKSCAPLSLTPLTYNVEDDIVFNILTSTVINNGRWIKEDGCQHLDPVNSHLKDDELKTINDKVKIKDVHEKLDCGEYVNYTIYDHLAGVANRHLHPTIPEPDIIDLFDKTGSKKHLDIKQLERKLRKAKKEKPNSTEVFNQIGNYWRIKGDIRQSIECFRRSLWISANDAESLLNLAVVLFTLQYLEDAIFLAKRSIEAQPPKQSAWLHHFKLGEILKAYGHYHEASLHFRQTLDLNPSFQQASLYLKDMESLPDTTVHICTFFIITILVLAVLLGVLSTVEAHSEDCVSGYKTKRHFNRAMAMHSIKLGMNPRSLRCKKHHS